MVAPVKQAQFSEVNAVAAAVGPRAASDAALEMKCAGKTKGLDLWW